MSQGKGQQGTGSKAGGYHDLKVYGPDGEVAVPMVPKRALELAQELLTRGVQAIKADWPGTTLPRRGPDLGSVAK